MAVAVAGSMENVELGFAPQRTAVASLGGTVVGYLDGDVSLSAPREYAYVRAAMTPIKAIATAKNLTVAFSAKEVLLTNIQQAWDSDSAAIAASVYTLDADVGATIALLLKTYAPNSPTVATPANLPISRVISVPKALPTGAGSISIPRASSGDSNQSLAMEFTALGDTASNELLATITDTYT